MVGDWRAGAANARTGTGPDLATGYEGGREAAAEGGPPTFRIQEAVLAAATPLPHPRAMFSVTEAEAALIRTAFDERGELSAAVELRRIFPGITDNAKARECARIIAGWSPVVRPPATVTRLRPRRG
jgi:hypothetical protein